MRVLFISTIAPYPKNVGKKVVLGGFCDYFREACGPKDFELMCFEAAEVGPDVHVTVLGKPGMLQKVWNLAFHSLISRKKSIQEALFWSDRTLRAIKGKIAEFNPDVIIFDTVRTGQYMSHLDRGAFRSILYMDDLFSVRYERILAAMKKFPRAGIDAMGNFAGNIPRFLLPIYRSSSVIKRLLLRLERRLIQRSEYAMPADFDVALLISGEEVRHLKAHTAATNVLAVSPMLDMEEQYRVTRSWSDRREFVFLGSLNLAHNAFSIENFIEGHMEQMIVAMPDCLLRIIGKFPSANLLRLAAQYPEHIVVEGFVEDLDTVLSCSAAMIAPLVFGSGMKIKVIDAIRLGVPVIATSYGAEGITTMAGKGILVEDDLSRFASLCKTLLDADVNREHSDYARRIYLENYSSEAVGKQYDALFQVREHVHTTSHSN